MLKVTVITICYNNEGDIRNTLESVVAQDYSNLEYIVIDGNSSDNTLKIIQEFASRISRIVSEPDNGMYDAINKGLMLATGEIVGLIHAGDRLFDNFVISKIADHFKSNDIDAMYGHSILVNANEDPVRVNKSPSFRKSLFKAGWMPSHQSVYIKRRLLDQLGYYREDLGGSGDYEFVLRYFFFNDLKIMRLDSFILQFTIGGRSTSNYGKNLWKSQQRHITAWRLNGANPPFYFIPFKLLRKGKQFFLALWFRFFGYKKINGTQFKKAV